MKWQVAIIRCQTSPHTAEMIETAVQVLVEMIEEDLASEVTDIREGSAVVDEISATMIELIDDLGAELVFTIGGIGMSAHDCVPEATRNVIERELPGVAESMRTGAMSRDPLAIVHRGLAGIKGRSLIVNLPEEPSTILEYMKTIIPVLPSIMKILKYS